MWSYVRGGPSDEACVIAGDMGDAIAPSARDHELGQDACADTDPAASCGAGRSDSAGASTKRQRGESAGGGE